ncbi:hypothetical protein COCSADRAFT_280488 [Bipolaris sorokiniana ND90Pr]|uniref:Secreted protein n=1 Tax=Cochliobolus sativus (strain ND90Pr / ATCC 201652) TaxID=665912 RepID=M2S7J2_COCSN|nr:uncharacterized protein COCSADRAFT_280488 [Bipolaris sorokiniana ND90Pr]EMD58345.1 hypothetical protein COCSADRAFT_280488 [Bipolaris sorokiniana ND90Pr]
MLSLILFTVLLFFYRLEQSSECIGYRYCFQDETTPSKCRALLHDLLCPIYIVKCHYHYVLNIRFCGVLPGNE